MSHALQKQTVSTSEYIIAGLGETGLSVATFFYNRGIPFVMADTRVDPPLLNTFKQKFPDVDFYVGEFPSSEFSKANKIVISPGVDVKNKTIQSAINDGAECYGDIEIFANNTQTPIVAITGSNGKSTVTSLVAEMAKSVGMQAYAGGNLGPPALDLLDHTDAELFVLELSSFQLESTKSLQPKVATVLNISADHLDRHGDMRSYADIKSKVFNQAKNSVINRDDVMVADMHTSGTVTSFGLSQPANNEFGLTHEGNETYLMKGDKRLLAIGEIAMRGEAGILNSLAALTIGERLGLSQEKMLATLKRFKGLPHRFSVVGESNGVTWINDSKGTNIGATISSLQGLKENIVLLAGGVFKGGDLSLLHDAVAMHVKYVILFGQDARTLNDVLKDAARLHTVNSMRDAVIKARELAQAGDHVLLSPACASFDMYENYIARGEDFESCVRELAL